MKKFTKRIAGFLLSAILLFALCLPGFAADAIQPRIDFVATMQIASYSGGGGLSSSLGINGHSFIIISNISDKEITVGHMPVAAGESVTIGTYGNRAGHSGIWYNIEGYWGYRGFSSTVYGLHTGLTSMELISVNRTINNNDSWALTNNCSSFAAKVWNTTNSGEYGRKVSGGNPSALASSIRSFSTCITNPTVPSKGLDTIARQTSSGYQYDSSGAYGN